MEGVIRDHWREAVTDAQGRQRVNRLTYEMGVLQASVTSSAAKKSGSSGPIAIGTRMRMSPRTCGPTRPTYYAALNLPGGGFFSSRSNKRCATNSRRWIDPAPQCRGRDSAQGQGLDQALPLAPQPEPTNLLALKMEITKRWPMTSLLDVLKETDLRVDFTRFFRSPTPWENLDRATLQYRLLLALYGLGTGAGLKRVAMGNQGLAYKDLPYIRRRFITPDAVRQSIAAVVNRLFEARLPQFWGEDITACLRFPALPGVGSTLLTEWHARYGKPGIMIYWHVDRKAACIYSQLKTCSSSEVAAMIEGVLRHCTTMEVDRQYVDSHGQSAVAFARSAICWASSSCPA